MERCRWCYSPKIAGFCTLNVGLWSAVTFLIAIIVVWRLHG